MLNFFPALVCEGLHCCQIIMEVVEVASYKPGAVCFGSYAIDNVGKQVVVGFSGRNPCAMESISVKGPSLNPMFTHLEPRNVASLLAGHFMRPTMHETATGHTGQKPHPPFFATDGKQGLCCYLRRNKITCNVFEWTTRTS